MRDDSQRGGVIGANGRDEKSRSPSGMLYAPESGRTLMAVLPKEGAYENTFYSKVRRFASQLMKPGDFTHWENRISMRR